MEFDDDRLRFTLNIDGEYKIVAPDPNQTLGLPADTWLYIAGPYDGKFLKIYLNSILIDSIPGTGLIYYLYNNALLFGVDAVSSIYPGPYLEYFFNGWLDEIKNWEYARNSTEIEEDMYSIHSGNEDGLIGYWNFDDGNVTDLSPFDNHGVLIGDPMITSSDDLDICSMQGDVNSDFDLNFLDMVLIINFIIDGENGELFLNCADINEDGAVNILDIVAILNIIISS